MQMNTTALVSRMFLTICWRLDAIADELLLTQSTAHPPAYLLTAHPLTLLTVRQPARLRARPLARALACPPVH